MSARPLNPRTVPLLFVAAFALVIAVNGTMMWLAISSFSGLYSGHARERGLHYNDIVAAQADRDALGWKVENAWRPQSGRLEITVARADGAPLAGARVRVDLVRPAERRPPIAVDVANLGDGHFAGQVDLPERGNWDLDIVVEAEGRRYAVTRRAFLR